MPRKKTLYFGFVNVKLLKTELQTPANYIKLLKNIVNFTQKKPLKVYADYHVVLTDFIDKKGYFIIHGYRYLELNPEKPVIEFDNNEIRKIVDEDGNPIPVFDNRYKPHSDDIYLLFFPDYHRFVYLLNSPLSPNQIRRLFKQLAEKVTSPGKFEAFVETDSDEVINILKRPDVNIKKIAIKFSLPNEDDFGEYAKMLEKEMIERHANSHKIEEISYEGDYKIDKYIEANIELASKYGEIEAKLINEEGKVEELKSEEHPLKYKLETYSDIPFSQILNDLYQLAIRILRQLRK